MPPHYVHCLSENIHTTVWEKTACFWRNRGQVSPNTCKNSYLWYIKTVFPWQHTFLNNSLNKNCTIHLLYSRHDFKSTRLNTSKWHSYSEMSRTMFLYWQKLCSRLTDEFIQSLLCSPERIITAVDCRVSFVERIVCSVNAHRACKCIFYFTACCVLSVQLSSFRIYNMNTTIQLKATKRNLGSTAQWW